jgi:pimeloyl-ACP methyl ester carboxylesterase
VEFEFTPFHRGGSGPPLLLIHGFTDTWRSWDLVIPALERQHEVLAVTLAGHAGGPPLKHLITDFTLADAVEHALDGAGFDLPDIVGNSLGGYVALELAARGRARSVVGFAPAGGWVPGDLTYVETAHHFRNMHKLLPGVVPHIDAIVATDAGRRNATQLITVNYEHIPAELIAHQTIGAARCDVIPLVEYAEREGYRLRADQIDCPVRIVWGAADQILTLPKSRAGFVELWLPNADYIELPDVGHCPQLDVPAVAADLILGFTAPG